MNLKTLRIFNELGSRKVGSNDISIHSYVDKSGFEYSKTIIAYLNECPIYDGWMQYLDDVIDLTRRSVVPDGYLTDGVWEWSFEIAYCVENHHLLLPTSFLSHCKSFDWRIPQSNDIPIVHPFEPQLLSKNWYEE